MRRAFAAAANDWKNFLPQSRVKPGLRDVAQLANVSLATASRVISRSGSISQDAILRVEQACRELQYIPNRVARHLSRDRSETVGVIVPTIGNPLFAPTIDGIRSVLDQHNYGMLMNSAERDPKRELKQVRTLIEYGVDAILTLMPVHDPELYDLIDYARVPVVYMSSAGNPGSTPTVDFDNAEAMATVVKYVLEMGHSRIAILSGPRATTPVLAARLQSAQRALEDSGNAPPSNWIQESDFDPDAARLAARSLLTASNRPTAIVCTGDQHAVAAVSEAQALGLRVPQDISITGCNDVAVARLCYPQLTTVHLPYRELGEVACRIAMQLCSGKTAPERIFIPTTLVVRDSVARSVRSFKSKTKK